MRERFNRLKAARDRLSVQNGWRSLVAVGLSLFFTTLIWFAIDRYETNRWLEWGGQLTRQVLAQWEGQVFVAKRLGETRPSEWATRQLSLGSEERRVRVQLTALETLGGQPEIFKWNAEEKVFELTHALLEGAVKISVRATQSHVVRDLAGGFFFLASLFGALWGLGRRQVEEVEEVTQSAIYGESNPVIGEFRRWLSENRQNLTTLGGSVRDMVKEAKELAVGSGKSRSVLAVLRDRMHSGLTHVHQCGKDLKEAAGAASEAEVHVLNFLIEVNRFENELPPQLSPFVEEVHRSLREIRTLQDRSEKKLSDVERELEPWMVDVDTAFDLHQNVFQTTRQLNAQISRTMQNLVEQAKWNQEAKQLLETHEQGISKSWPEVG